MKIGIETLGLLNQLGESAVRSVERRVVQFGGDEPAVESTPVGIDFVEPGTLARRFGDDHRVGVRVRINGMPNGYVLVLLAPSSANRLLGIMLQNTVEDVTRISERMAVSTLVEFGGLVANAWLDALADAFDQHIATATPIVVDSTTSQVVARLLAKDEDHGFYFSSKTTIVPDNIEFEVYVFPENEAFVDLLTAVDRDAVVA